MELSLIRKTARVRSFCGQLSVQLLSSTLDSNTLKKCTRYSLVADLTHSISWRTRLQTVNQSHNNHLHTPTPRHLSICCSFDLSTNSKIFVCPFHYVQTRSIRVSRNWKVCTKLGLPSSRVESSRDAPRRVGPEKLTTTIDKFPLRSYTIAHVLVLFFRAFCCCCCFCFLFWGFSLFVTSIKKELQPWRSRNAQCEPNWGYTTQMS